MAMRIAQNTVTTFPSNALQNHRCWVRRFLPSWESNRHAISLLRSIFIRRRANVLFLVHLTIPFRESATVMSPTWLYPDVSDRSRIILLDTGPTDGRRAAWRRSNGVWWRSVVEPQRDRPDLDQGVVSPVNGRVPIAGNGADFIKRRLVGEVDGEQFRFQ